MQLQIFARSALSSAIIARDCSGRTRRRPLRGRGAFLVLAAGSVTTMLAVVTLTASLANAWLLEGLALSAAGVAPGVMQTATASGKESAVSATGSSSSSSSASASTAQGTQAAAGTAQSSASSIVASLSSAVASAAAAGVAAAAHNALLAADGRSHSSVGTSAPTSGTNSNDHSSRSPTSAASAAARHLAIKLTESMIPDVPYNILHNMKKIDHAAPFYAAPGAQNRPFVGKASDLPGAASLGAVSGQSPVSVAPATSAVVAGLEQLQSLLQSPLLRRLAEGYGEFTSEFRSRFRPQIKAPSSVSQSSAPVSSGVSALSSTSRLLRDISVPALLMLLVSAIPSEWRPVRTRRKSPPAADAFDALKANLNNVGQQQQFQQHQPLDIQFQLANFKAAMAAINAANSPNAAAAGDPLLAASSPSRQIAAATPNGDEQHWLTQDLAILSRLLLKQQLRHHQTPAYGGSQIARRSGGNESQNQVAALALAKIGAKLASLASSASSVVAGDKLQHGALPVDDKSRYYMLPDESGTYIGGATAGNIPERRELAQMLPQAWRDAVKRTMSSVQATATSGLKSLEAQLATWMQEKMRILPAAGGSGSVVPSASPDAPASPPIAQKSSGQQAANGTLVASASSMISALSSSALNMLGLVARNGSTSAAGSETQQVPTLKASLTSLAGTIVSKLAPVASSAVPAPSSAVSQPVVAIYPTVTSVSSTASLSSSTSAPTASMRAHL